MPVAVKKSGKIAQWGNSAAVRLPSSILERANLHAEEAVEVIAGDDEIIIRRARPRVTLDDLLSRYDPEQHRHALMLDDAPRGGETI